MNVWLCHATPTASQTWANVAMTNPYYDSSILYRIHNAVLWGTVGPQFRVDVARARGDYPHAGRRILACRGLSRGSGPSLRWRKRHRRLLASAGRRNPESGIIGKSGLTVRAVPFNWSRNRSVNGHSLLDSRNWCPRRDSNPHPLGVSFDTAAEENIGSQSRGVYRFRHRGISAVVVGAAGFEPATLRLTTGGSAC
jgi:hypothetical protein